MSEGQTAVDPSCVQVVTFRESASDPNINNYALDLSASIRRYRPNSVASPLLV
jgi:hypothetical protein